MFSVPNLPASQRYIGPSTNTKPVVNVRAGDTFLELDTGNTYMFDGSTWIEYEMKYKDLGLVLDAANMAAGATVYSNWYDNLLWVRNMIYRYSSDQQVDMRIMRRDSSLSPDSGDIIKGTIAANNSNWNSVVFAMGNSTTSSGITGYSAKFGLKNSAASPNTFGKLKVQLLGA